MIFMEFTPQDPDLREESGREYFVGTDEETILQDTHQGTEYGGVVYKSYRIVEREYVKKQDLPFFDEGVAVVSRRSRECFWLGSEFEEEDL